MQDFRELTNGFRQDLRDAVVFGLTKDPSEEVRQLRNNYEGLREETKRVLNAVIRECWGILGVFPERIVINRGKVNENSFEVPLSKDGSKKIIYNSDSLTVCESSKNKFGKEQSKVRFTIYDCKDGTFGVLYPTKKDGIKENKQARLSEKQIKTLFKLVFGEYAHLHEGIEILSKFRELSERSNLEDVSYQRSGNFSTKQIGRGGIPFEIHIIEDEDGGSTLLLHPEKNGHIGLTSIEKISYKNGICLLHYFINTDSGLKGTVEISRVPPTTEEVYLGIFKKNGISDANLEFFSAHFKDLSLGLKLQFLKGSENSEKYAKTINQCIQHKDFLESIGLSPYEISAIKGDLIYFGHSSNSSYVLNAVYDEKGNLKKIVRESIEVDLEKKEIKYRGITTDKKLGNIKNLIYPESESACNELFNFFDNETVYQNKELREIALNVIKNKHLREEFEKRLEHEISKNRPPTEIYSYLYALTCDPNNTKTMNIIKFYPLEKLIMKQFNLRGIYFVNNDESGITVNHVKFQIEYHDNGDISIIRLYENINKRVVYRYNHDRELISVKRYDSDLVRDKTEQKDKKSEHKI